MTRSLLCALLLACGGNTEPEVGDAPTPEPDAPACAASALPLGTPTTVTLTHDGRERSYRVRLPTSYDNTPRPVVFALHGGFGTAEQIETRQADFDPIADRENVIMVYPNGIAANEDATNPIARAQTWNGGTCCGPAMTQNVDDVGFLTTVLDRVEATACVDPGRVFFTGMSNGGIMSYRMACERADRITAIAPVAGSLLTSCTPSRPVPLFAIHGTLDENVPYTGGTGCGQGMVVTDPIPEIVENWAGFNGCTGASLPGFTEGDGSCVSSGTCDAETILCSIADGDHSWPGADTDVDTGCGTLGGRPSTTFRASEAIWAFFARQ